MHVEPLAADVHDEVDRRRGIAEAAAADDAGPVLPVLVAGYWAWTLLKIVAEVVAIEVVDLHDAGLGAVGALGGQAAREADAGL